MQKLLLVCAVFMAVVITGESLTCNTCRVGIGGKCLFSSTEICSDSQNNCYWGKLSFNISSLISMQTRGCLTTALCNQTETGTLLTAGYTVTRTCCSTDCCNGAESIQLHLTAASVAALVVIWSSWGN